MECSAHRMMVYNDWHLTEGNVMNEELIAQLQAYDDLVVTINRMQHSRRLIAERWIKNYQQMTGSSQVPLDVLKDIVDHVLNMED